MNDLEHRHDPARYCPFCAWMEERIVEATKMGDSLHSYRDSFHLAAFQLHAILEVHKKRCSKCV
jgi:hypothetical protein